MSKSGEQKRAQKRAQRTQKSKVKKKTDLAKRVQQLKQGRDSYSRFYSTYDGGNQ